MGMIRFTLALIVLAGHAGFWSGSIGARASVQIFFVLSGIYMAAVYTTKYSLAEHSARTFYFNRALRLWPTYLFLLGLTALVWVVAGQTIGNADLIFNLFESSGAPSYGMSALAVLLFGQDIASVNETLHYLLPVRQSWSIGSELLFYLSVPLILRQPRPNAYFIGFAVLMAFKFWALRYTGDDRLSYFFPLGNYGYFLLGCGLYFVTTMPRVEAVKRKLGRLRWLLLALLLGALLWVGEASFERGGLIRHFALVGVFSIAAVLLFERSTHPLGLMLGNLSYGVYLNHFLLLSIFMSLGMQGWTLLATAIFASTALSFLTERYLQEPINRFRYRRISNKRSSQSPSNPPESGEQSQGASA